MPQSDRQRPPLHRARRASRYLLLLIVPVAIAFKFYFDRAALPDDPAGFSFARPAQWSYLTRTPVKPTDGRIRFSGEALREAFVAGHTAPLFALTRYPPPHAGINPVIGVNLAWEGDGEAPGPQDVLERSVADMQEHLGDGLELLSPIATTMVAGLPAARVEIGAPDPPPGRTPERLTVLAVLADGMSFLIAGSGAFDGTERVDEQLSEFAGSLVIERH